MKYVSTALLFVVTAMLCSKIELASASNHNATNSTSDSHAGFVEMGYRFGSTSGSKAVANEYQHRNDGAETKIHFNARKSLYEIWIDGMYSGDSSSDAQSSAQRNTYDFDLLFRKTDLFSMQACANRYGSSFSDGLTSKRNVSDAVYTKNPSVTHDFSYNRQRSTTGIKAEMSWATPFFASVRVDNLAVTGLAPLYGIDDGNVPYPVDFEVNTLTGEIGYQSERLTVLLNAGTDSLENNSNEMRADRNLAGELTGDSKKPIQESLNYNLGGAITYRMPAIHSTAMLNASYSRLTSDAIKASRTSDNADILTSWDKYEGDLKTTSLNGALSSTLWKGGTSKIYGRYYQKDNDSTIEYNQAWLASATENALLQATARDRMAFFEYGRHLMGAELNQRLGEYRVQGGIEREETHRNAYGVTRVKNTEDLKAWSQVRTSFTDTISGHVRYGFLDRTSSLTEDTTGGAVTNPSSGVIAPWVGYTDSATKQSHSIKAGAEWNPADTLTVSLDYVFTTDDYADDTPLGPSRGVTHEGIADLSYTYGPVSFNIFGGIEKSENRFTSRRYNGVGAIDGAYPNQADTMLAYNWNYKQVDTTYTAGIGSKIDIIKDTLLFQIFYDYSQNNGKTYFNIPEIAGFSRKNIDDVNDYKMHNLNAKLTYTITEVHSVALGYGYSRLEYKDWAYDNKITTESDRIDDGYYGVNKDYESHVTSIFYRYTF